MSITWNDGLLKDVVNKKVYASLEIAGEILESEAKHRAPVDRGELRNGITHKVYKDKSVRCSSNEPYSLMTELGGKIKPDKAGALSIPVHPDAIKWVKQNGDRSIREFPDELVLIKRKGKSSLLIREKTSNKTKNKRFDIMFVLVKSARIPEQPYLRPAFFENQDKLLRVFSNGH